MLATSGTAPAHWYPAILEAEAAGLPLVCVSANRPTSLMGCGAPQTLDQHGLFGQHVRFFADLGDPRADAGWLRHAERTVRRALAASPDIQVDFEWLDAGQRDRWPVNLGRITNSVNSLALGAAYRW